MIKNTDSIVEYTTIDLARLFFCICIVFLHSGAYHLLPGEWFFLHCILRLAVPFFFVVSGFFWGLSIYQGDKELNTCLKNYERRLILPYIVFSIINIVLAVTEMILNGEKIYKIAFKIIRSIIFYPYGALWYVWASMVAVILLFWFIKKEKITLAIVIGVILYGLALLMNSYYFLIDGLWVQKLVDLYLKITTSARNGVFVGFIFIGLGVCLAKYRRKLQEIRWMVISLIIMAISYMILIGEVIFIQGKKTADDHSLFLSFLFLIPSMVWIMLYFNVHIKKRNAILCRNLSAGVYYLHRGILSIITLISLFWGIKINTLLKFAIVLIISIFLCLYAYKTKKEPYYTLLK